MTRPFASALGASLVFACAISEAGTASGAFKLRNGQPIAPKYATAYIVRDGINARQKQVELLLTEKPVDGAAIQRALDPHVAAVYVGSADDTNYIMLLVTPDGVVHMNATYSDLRQYNNDSTSDLKATLTTNTPTKIEGRLVSTRPLTGMRGATYTVDISFSADVPPRVIGQVLPAGGGDPGKAFLGFLTTVQKKNWTAIKAASTPEFASGFEEPRRAAAENAAAVAERVALWMPTSKLVVATGDLRGDTAMLDVEGETDGLGALTLVRMVKVGTAWKVAEIRRSGYLKR